MEQPYTVGHSQECSAYQTGLVAEKGESAGALAPTSTAGGNAQSIGCLPEDLSGLGIAMISCGPDGKIINFGNEWLSKLFGLSPLFQRCLAKIVELWAGQGEPEVAFAMPGVWLIGIPITRRRRRIGYTVGIIPTADLLHAEQLPAMCQAAQFDLELARQMLMKAIAANGSQEVPPLALSPASDPSINRIAGLVKRLHQTHLVATSDRQAVESVGRQLAESYEEMNLLYAITQSMTVREPPERFIMTVCEDLLATLPYEWVGLQLMQNSSRLRSLSGRMLWAGVPREPVSAIRATAQRVLIQTLDASPMILEPATKSEHAIFAPLGQHVLVHPVMATSAIQSTERIAERHATEVIGLLIAGDKYGPDMAASNIDIKLLRFNQGLGKLMLRVLRRSHCK